MISLSNKSVQSSIPRYDSVVRVISSGCRGKIVFFIIIQFFHPIASTCSNVSDEANSGFALIISITFSVVHDFNKLERLV